MPLVYLRNRARSSVAWALETLVRRSQPAYEIDPMLHTYSERWEPLSSEDAVEHPQQPGLWLFRRAVDSAGIADLRGLVASTMITPRPRSVHDEAEAAEREAALLIKQARKLPQGTEWAVEASEQALEALARCDRLRAAAASQPAPRPPHRTATAWEWHPFEPGRLMAPMLSHEAAEASPLIRPCGTYPTLRSSERLLSWTGYGWTRWPTGRRRLTTSKVAHATYSVPVRRDCSGCRQSSPSCCRASREWSSRVASSTSFSYSSEGPLVSD
jgi:hypothetical protein